MRSLTIAELESWLTETFAGLMPKASWGERSYFYNPDGSAPHGTYFLTVKEKNGDNDTASALDRPEVWRLNFGVAKPEFMRRFGPPPPRPAKGTTIAGPWDFTALDTLTPHPVYGWMGWVAVVNPSAATFEEVKPLLHAAYAKSRAAFDGRTARKRAGRV